MHIVDVLLVLACSSWVSALSPTSLSLVRRAPSTSRSSIVRCESEMEYRKRMAGQTALKAAKAAELLEEEEEEEEAAVPLTKQEMIKQAKEARAEAFRAAKEAKAEAFRAAKEAKAEALRAAKEAKAEQLRAAKAKALATKTDVEDEEQSEEAVVQPADSPPVYMSDYEKRLAAKLAKKGVVLTPPSTPTMTPAPAPAPAPSPPPTPAFTIPTPKPQPKKAAPKRAAAKKAPKAPPAKKDGIDLPNPFGVPGGATFRAPKK